MPTGGQFAPASRPEATGIQLSEDRALSDEAVLAEATRWGQRYARRYGVEVAEVIGEAAVRFYEQRARRASTTAPAVNEAGYLNTLARSIALEAIGADRSYVRQAWRRYQTRCDERMQELGRELSSAEEDELAASIVAAQEPRRRAPADFHRTRRVRSIDAPVHRPGSHDDPRSLDETLAGADDTEQLATAEVHRLGAVGEAAEWLATSGDHAGARRLAWDALAELAGAPSVKASSVTERRAASARRAVRGAGGAGAVAAAYTRGLAEPEQADALFAPYGPISDEQRDAVADVLASRRHLADELWDMALRAATIQRGGPDA
ncbi:MAG: hypothetical protein M0010_21245 [Actinomycetota bacterium]|nr:hypothetical protein [Actinomycetota bacterium]